MQYWCWKSMHESYTVYIYMYNYHQAIYLEKTTILFLVVKTTQHISMQIQDGQVRRGDQLQTWLTVGSSSFISHISSSIQQKEMDRKVGKTTSFFTHSATILTRWCPSSRAKLVQVSPTTWVSGIFWYISRYLSIYLSIYLYIYLSIYIYIYIHISIIDVCEGSKPTNTGGAPTCRFLGKNSHSASLRGQRTSSACRCWNSL